ncbi:MAG: hypothetical protein JWR55_1358 [Aeromicrobium sp.]|nr:hypothetical protein [Aeromicrobium sp.]
MRKFFIVLAALAVAIGVFSPAEAAKKKFSVSGYADNRKMDLDSSTGGNRTTKIKGKVRGGKLKGKTVAFYATNTHTAAQKRHYIGSAKLSSKGGYSKLFRPSEGGTYRIEIVKKAGGGRAAGTKTITVRAYEWPILSHFHDPAASTLTSRADKEQTGTGRSSTERWSTSYAIQGTGSAVFNTGGYDCWRFNLKLAISQDSRASTGTFQISQGATVLARQTMSKGDRYWEPSRSLSERFHPEQPFVVSIFPEDGAADPTAVRFILGNPKASCTFPSKTARYR